MQPGFRLLPEALDRAAQRALLQEVAALLHDAPPYVPRMPNSGQPMSVRMTNCGPLGWMTDKEGGYRYQATHPETGRPWPAMPQALLALWKAVADYPPPPEACLVNLYSAEARMGLHRDMDEEDQAAPVVSLSLGDTALFRLGGTSRKDPTRSVKLASGDAVVLGGEARHCFHGVDRVIPGTSTLLEGFPLEGVRRVNLTLRRVTGP
ncbi:MAG: alpha-ketoglutarate-dependent dioxygenase AlkB [Rhodovibrionaceae bacterium]